MEIYYSGRGTGNLLARDPETRKLHTIKQGRNNVPDSIAEMLLQKYPNVISTNEEVRTAKVEKSALADDNASLRAKVKELEDQNKKLQLIAVGEPVVDTKSAEKITALERAVKMLELERGPVPAGKHPDEVKPRGATWLDERSNWQSEVDSKAKYIAALETRIAELEKANKEYEELINAPASLNAEKPAHGKKAKVKDGDAEAPKTDVK